MTASPAQRALARRILTWAWSPQGGGRRLTEAQILRDMPTWAARYNAAHTPEQELTVAQAAAALELTETAVRRYLAPSSGRLTRHAGGVSARSVAVYRIRRDEGLARTRWTKATPLRRTTRLRAA